MNFLSLLTKKSGIFFFLFLPLLLCSQNKKDSVFITLDKALEIALSESPTMQIAGRDVEVKKYYKKEQIVSLFPDVSYSGSYNRTLQKQKMTMDFGGQSMEIEVGTFNNYSNSVSLSLPLVMPTLWQNLKLSQLDVELALESARASKISLINQVKQAFYTYLFAKESYQVLLVNYANVELNKEIVTDKFNEGMASEFDKLRAEVQLKNQLPNITAAENAIILSEMMLKVIIGLEVDEPIIIQGTLSDFENSLSNSYSPDPASLSIQNNSSVQQLEIAIKQLSLSKKMLISSSCPSLSLGGSFQYYTMSNNFKFSEYNWFPYSVLGLTLNIPITSWASAAYKMNQTKLSLLNLEDQKVNLERNLQVSIISNVNNIEKAIADYNSNKETVLQAERAYSISKKQYEIGMATWLDLSSTELALTSARLAFKESIYNYLTAYAKLEEVLGNTDR